MAVESAPLDTAREYLHSHNVLSLATCTDNSPWVAPVFYAVYSGKLIFLSAAHTRHSRAIAVNPAVSGSVQQDYTNWSDIKGLQLRGIAQLVDNDLRKQVLAAYAEKFPVVGPQAPPQIAKAMDKVSWYEIDVQEALFVDNSRGFGHRDSIDPVALFAK